MGYLIHAPEQAFPIVRSACEEGHIPKLRSQVISWLTDKSFRSLR
jgi:hypothetical protein